MVNIHDLEITNVTQEYPTKSLIDITFDLINGRRYLLPVRKDEKGIFRPFTVYHVYDSKKMNDCPYCDGSPGGCRGLKMHKNELFLQLIKHPSIRLEWLYVDHV